MLTAVEAKNFKCFGEDGINLRLAPLTILVGPNGSGKSSVLDAVALFAQTAWAPNFEIQWTGPWTDLGPDGSFAFNRRDPGARMRLGFTLSDGDTLVEWQHAKGFRPERHLEAATFEYVFEHSARTEEWAHEIAVGNTLTARNEMGRISRSPTGGGFNESLRYLTLPEVSHITFQPGAIGPKMFLPALFRGSPVKQVLDPTSVQKLASLINDLTLVLDYVVDTLKTRVFLVGARRAPAKTQVSTAPSSVAVGRNGERTLEVLSTLFASPDYSAQAACVRRWANVFGLETLVAGWAGGRFIDAGYTDHVSRTSLSVEYAGFGSQQLLPVIAQLFSAPRGSLIMVEEPEISLHPEAQVELIKMFGDAIHHGQQLLITTHSETLLLALPRLAAFDKLTPADVAVYHLSRDEAGAHAAPLQLEDTWYIRDWVPSFAEVESQLIKEWGTNLRGKLEAGK